MIGRLLALLYGLAACVAPLVTLLYGIGVLSGIGLTRGIDRPPDGDFATALAIDLGLLAAFALQHSVMARPGFKRAWTTMVPPAVERSTFVLASSAALGLLIWQWRPLGGIAWDVQDEWARVLLHLIAATGWVIVLVSATLIDGFEMLGLRQVFAYWRGVTPRPARFVTPGFYRLVRHPLYLGFLLGCWSVPIMSSTRLVLALTATAYILIGIQLEERDLAAVHPEYREYRRRVPMLLPWLGGGR